MQVKLQPLRSPPPEVEAPTDAAPPPEPTDVPPPTVVPTREPTDLVVYTPVRYGDIVERTVGEAMKEQFNTTVIWQDLLASEMTTKVIAEQSAPSASVACPSVLSYLQTKDAGLWDQIDPSIVTNIDNLFDEARILYSDTMGGNGVPIAASTIVIQYLTDVFDEKGFEPPTSLTDLANPEYAGHVMLTSTSSGVGIRQIVMLAMLAGGDEFDVDPGFDYAKQLVDMGQIHSFPTRSSEFNETMARGEAWIGIQYSEGGYQFKADGQPVDFVVPAEGALPNFTTCHPIVNAPEPELAQHFVNFMIGEEFQRELALDRWAIPVVKGIDLPPEYAAVLPLSADEWSRFQSYDFVEVAEKRPEWHERWTREIEASQ